MKKIIACLCAAALSVSIAACGNQTTSDHTYPNTVLTGEVQAVTDTSVTLLLGELTTQEPAEGGQQPPELPQEGDGAQADEAASTETPLEEGTASQEEQATTGEKHQKPSEGESGQRPEKPSGEKPSGKPDKKTDSESEAAETTETASVDAEVIETAVDTAPSDLLEEGDSDGEVPELPNSEPDPLAMGGMTTFTEGEETVTLTVTDDALDELAGLQPGDVIQVETNEAGEVTTLSVINLDSGMNGGPGGGSTSVEQGTAAYTLAADGEYTDETYTSTGDDENALRVDGAAVTLNGITVEKSAGSSSNVESGDFYGMNAALLATNGAEVTISNAKITSAAQNGNGVFSYGEGTVVNISDSTIETSADNSGGIQTTGGGTTNANDLTVTTQGNSSAAIRSDRGGGTVNVDGGSYTSNGLNSPAVYSTADITVKNAVLTANNSEALVIEGQNSIDLIDCDVSGNMSATQGSSSDINVHNVMIYQSMSGDAAVGTSTFRMTGGTLTGNSGDMIYVTNTNSVIELSGVEIVNRDADVVLLRVTGNDASRGWGTAGANGAQVTMTATDQVLDGDIIIDTISTLDLTLSGSSTFTGTIQFVENEAGGAAAENNAVVTIEAGSTWTLTGDCVITSLDNQGTINFNGHTITLADGTVLSE